MSSTGLATGADFVGQGWAWPAGVSRTGGIALVGGDTELEQAIRLILGTALGERPMRPEYGCGIHDLLFDPSDGTLAGLVAHEVRASLLRWEPRVDVAEIRVTFDRERPGLALIDVSYVVRTTNDRRNLVVPFYSIPEEH